MNFQANIAQASSGPTFGGGFDMYINLSNKEASYSNLGFSYQNANPNPVIQVVNNCLISVTYYGPYFVLLVVFVQRTDLCELFGIQIFNLVRSESKIYCYVNTFEKDIPRSYCRKS